MVGDSVSQASLTSLIVPFIVIGFMLFFLIIGIFLTIKSKKEDCKTLKMGILVSLTNNFFILALMVSGILIFKTSLFFYLGMFIGAIPMFFLATIALGISTYTYFKHDNKNLALASFGYATVFLAYSGFYILSMELI